jgi:hypothetical protein
MASKGGQRTGGQGVEQRQAQRLTRAALRAALFFRAHCSEQSNDAPRSLDRLPTCGGMERRR